MLRWAVFEPICLLQNTHDRGFVFSLSPLSIRVVWLIVRERREKTFIEAAIFIRHVERSVLNKLIVSHVHSSIDLVFVGLQTPLGHDGETLGRGSAKLVVKME
jgi:hypothetical protein